MNKRHVLDIYPCYFQPVQARVKNFEIRRDQGFKVGDLLLLVEYDPIKSSYTGNSVFRTVTYITDYAQKENYVVLGIA